MNSYRTFEEFWPFYVSQHRYHATRVLHFIGTTLGFFFLALAAATGLPRYILSGIVSAYGLA